MDELVKAIATLMGHSDRQEVKKALHEKAQPVAQMFIDMGHGIATESFASEKNALNAAKAKAEADLAKATTDLEALRKEKPDVAAMQAQHQQALDNLKAEHQKALDKAKEKSSKLLYDRDLGKIEAKLIAKGVKPYIAKVLAKDPDLRTRIKHNDDDTPTVFQAGSRTPYSVATGQDSLDPLVEEIVKTVDAEGMSADDIDTGSGISGNGDDASGESNGSKGGGNSNRKASRFDQIRKDAEKKVSDSVATIQKARSAKFGGPSPAR